MARDYQQEAFAEQERNLVIREWMKERVANIHNSITAADVLSYYGTELYKHGNQEEQISCPFHGEDRHPSARYYPQSRNGYSAVWCFVCREQWDAIGLWRKFSGEAKFSEVLFNIEKAFGLTPPKHRIPTIEEEEFDPLQDEVDGQFDACESRLREERDQFDMEAHLKLGSIVDRLRYASDNRLLPLETVSKHLRQVLDKIGEKVRSR